MSETVDELSVESLVVTITDVVSDVESCEPLELPPLSDSVDVEALESFFTPEASVGGESESESEGEGGVAAHPLVVSFAYSDSVVHIDSGEQTTVSADRATDETVAHLDISPSDETDSLSHCDS